MQDLTVTIIQSILHWQQPEGNLAMFEEKIWSISSNPDLIVLPEMFTTGFSMEATEYAEPMGTRTFRWMEQMAAQSKAAIVGSYMVKDQGNYYNRLLWMNPDGTNYFYDKRHLFRLAQEHLTYKGGNNSLIVECKGWKICPQICYDLRFPVWNRNIYDPKSGTLAYDLLLFIANWPTPRIAAWDTLLQARAIENLCYTIGVNRVGVDGVQANYNGHSGFVNPKGQFISHFIDNEVIDTQVLERQPLDKLREKFPVYLDADTFRIDT